MRRVRQSGTVNVNCVLISVVCHSEALLYEHLEQPSHTHKDTPVAHHSHVILMLTDHLWGDWRPFKTMAPYHKTTAMTLLCTVDLHAHVFILNTDPEV